MTLHAQQQAGVPARELGVMDGRFSLHEAACDRLERLAQYFNAEPREVLANLIDNAYQRVLAD